MDPQQHNFISSLQKQWICPISRIPMEDPVITSDGYTYERSAIEQWLQTSDKSPITLLPLPNKTLIPNHAFKALSQKLYFQFPVYIDRQLSFKTQVSQLRQEVQFLKNQLFHEKQKVSELDERQERLFKTKKIEKNRQEQKNQQINIMRQQKNRLQRQIQSLKSIQQQQLRQIKSLKQEIQSFSQRFTEASAGLRDFRERHRRVVLNRGKILGKLRSSFSSNFTFIAHLLNSIQEAKEYESNLKNQQSSQETLQIGSSTQINNTNNSNGIIFHLEQTIKDTVNRAQRQQDQLFLLRRDSRIRSLINNPNILAQIQRGIGHEGHQDPNTSARVHSNPTNQSRIPVLQSNLQSSGRTLLQERARGIIESIQPEQRQNIFSQRGPTYRPNIFNRPQPHNIFSPINITGTSSFSNGPRNQVRNSQLNQRSGTQETQEYPIVQDRRQFWSNSMRRSNSINDSQSNNLSLQQQLIRNQLPQNSSSNQVNQQAIDQQRPLHGESNNQQQQAVINQSEPNNQNQLVLPSSNPLQQIQIQDQQEDSSLYKQLLTIKWMMSKRNYKQIPEFYNYRVCSNNDDQQTFWFGVHISVFQSRIPFNQYLSHSWNHVRWLDISACEVDDRLWRRFIERGDNFKNLMYINADRNKIETVKEEDLVRFRFLIKFSILRNRLNPETSIVELRRYQQRKSKVKVDFDDFQW